MRKTTFLISCMLALTAWGQSPVQVQTGNGNYDLDAAYSITFENGGKAAVIKSEGQDDLHVSLDDLKQIYFNASIADSLKSKIMQLDNCKIMQTLLYGNSSQIPSAFFQSYLNNPATNLIFIPTDEAFKKIPVQMTSSLSTPVRQLVLSIEHNENDSYFPFRGKVYIYDMKQDLVGRLLFSPLNENCISWLRQVVLNQIMNYSYPEYQTAGGCRVKSVGDAYQSPYQITAEKLGYDLISKIQVQDVLFDIMTPYGNKKCVVTNSLAAEFQITTYNALAELSPKFLQLMDVPVQLMVDFDFISDASEYTQVSFFKDFDKNMKAKFLWNSAHVDYTIFAPNNAAVDQAMKDNNLLSWEEIQALAQSGAGEEQVRTEITRLMNFIKGHIVYRDVFSVLEGNASATLQSNCMSPEGRPQAVEVKKLDNGALIINGKSVGLSSFRYVHDAWIDGEYDFYDNERISSGLVLQIDQAIVNE